jgi:hypothetical protein
MTLLAQPFLPQGEEEFLLLVVMRGMAGETGKFLMSGVLPREVLMALTATRAHCFRTGIAKTKDLAGVTVAVDVSRSRTMTRFASSLRRLMALQQGLVSRFRNGSIEVVVAGLAGVRSNIGRASAIRSGSLRPDGGHGEEQKEKACNELTHATTRSF